MNNIEKIPLTPIGSVKTKAVGKEVKNRQNISEIILHKDLMEALQGIENFSHLVIIFFMHRISNTKRRTLKVHPRGRKDMPLLGVYATRTPYRPNPIGVTVVKLVNVHQNILTVQGLDASNGTPIVDIKPLDPWDIPTEIRTPGWWKKLEKEKARA